MSSNLTTTVTLTQSGNRISLGKIREFLRYAENVPDEAEIRIEASGSSSGYDGYDPGYCSLSMEITNG